MEDKDSYTQEEVVEIVRLVEEYNHNLKHFEGGNLSPKELSGIIEEIKRVVPSKIRKESFYLNKTELNIYSK